MRKYTIQFKGSFVFQWWSSDAQAQTQIVAPSQYDGTINYFSAKISREFIFWKICFRQHHFVSKVIQQNAVLNLPECIEIRFIILIICLKMHCIYKQNY
jgi:hypothetical protein